MKVVVLDFIIIKKIWMKMERKDKSKNKKQKQGAFEK